MPAAGVPASANVDGDDRRGGAGAAHLEPAALAVGVVDRQAGVGIRDRGDVVIGPLRAAGVGLPGRLRVIRRAARAGAFAAGAAAPHGLGPAARVRRGAERGAADGGHVLRCCRVGDAVSVVTGRSGDRHAGMVVVLAVVGCVGGRLRTAVAVGHEVGAERYRGVHPGAQVSGVGAVRLDQDDVAQRADRRHHVDVERFLDVPSVAARCGRQRAGLALFVDLLEAAAAASGQAPVGAVSGEVGGGIRVVIGVDDSHRLAAARGGRRKGVGALQAGWSVTVAGWCLIRADRCLRAVRHVGADQHHARILAWRCGDRACAPVVRRSRYRYPGTRGARGTSRGADGVCWLC